MAIKIEPPNIIGAEGYFLDKDTSYILISKSLYDYMMQQQENVKVVGDDNKTFIRQGNKVYLYSDKRHEVPVAKLCKVEGQKISKSLLSESTINVIKVKLKRQKLI